MKKTLTATLIAAMAAPAMAGGPVVLEDTEVVAERPASNALIPLLVMVGIGLLIANGDDDRPQPTCISC